MKKLLGLQSIALITGLLALPQRASAQPALSRPVWNNSSVHFTLMNCTNTNVSYLIQTSTNLANWTPALLANSTNGSNFSISVSATNKLGFYRVTTNLLPLMSIMCKTNFDLKRNGFVADSFDSSNPLYSTSGMYDVTKRQANCNLGTLGNLTNSINIQNGNLYGYLYTGTTNLPGLGSQGVVGDLNYQAFPKHRGTIQSNHWMSNLVVNVPDVTLPNTTGWLTSFPNATNGFVKLSGMDDYVVTNLSLNLLISGTNTVWVNAHGSISLGVTFTNNGKLVLYVGEQTGTGDNLVWSGNNTCNVPGYAANLQIYGLSSLTSIDFHGNAAWTATVYAPEAAMTTGGGGNNTQDTSGAIVANSISLNGRWNFHYDQSLANSSFP